MKNLDVRVIVTESGLKYKDIADQIGISRIWLSPLMRYDLSAENRERILRAVKELRDGEEKK